MKYITAMVLYPQWVKHAHACCDVAETVNKYECFKGVHIDWVEYFGQVGSIKFTLLHSAN